MTHPLITKKLEALKSRIDGFELSGYEWTLLTEAMTEAYEAGNKEGADETAAWNREDDMSFDQIRQEARRETAKEIVENISSQITSLPQTTPPSRDLNGILEGLKYAATLIASKYLQLEDKPTDTPQ